MTNYRGLSPQDALAAWAKDRAPYVQKMQAGVPLSNDEARAFTEIDAALPQQNPQAWQLRKTGTDPRDEGGKSVRDVFNPDTGTWDTQDVKGYWSHPESWIQLAAGAGLGGVAAAGSLGANAAQGGLYGSEFLTPSVAGNAAAMSGAAGGAGGAALNLGSLAAPAIGIGGNVLSTYLSSRAMGQSQEAQAAAAKYAADLQDAANKRAEQFLREQAENQYQNSEVSRRGNYDQWRSREQRFSNLGAALGAGARDIPGYVAGIDPRYTSGSDSFAPPNGGVAGPGPQSTTVDGSAASISNYFKSRGVSDQETPYWVGKWAELQARGQEIGDPNYAMKRLAAADVFGGGGSQAPSYLPIYKTGPPIDYATTTPQPLTPRLPMPGTLANLAQNQGWWY